MPSEETIEIRHVRSVIGEMDDLPRLNPRVSLSSKIRTLLLKAFGVPQLIHTYGALEVNKTLTFGAGEDNPASLYSDGKDLYVGLATSPGRIVKVDLSTFTVASTLTLDAGEDTVGTLVSDGTFLYAGLDTAPGKVVKIRLSTFQKVSTLDLTGNNINALTSDGTFLYAGLSTIPGSIIQISLDTFTESSSLALAAGENNVLSFLTDGSYLYAGLGTVPGKVVKVDLGTFTSVSTLTLDAGDENARFLSSDGTYLYAGLGVNPGKLVKIDLSSFTIVSVLTFAAGNPGVNSMFSDGTFIYVGVDAAPGRILKIDMSDFTVVSTVVYAVGEDSAYSLFSDGTYIYTGFYDTTPGKVSRRYIIPTTDLRQKKTDLLHEQNHTGIYSVYPTLATGTLLTSNVAAWTKGNYAQVVPASTITTTFYITGVVLFGLTANTEYEVDIATGAAASESVIATVFHKTDNANLAHECIFPVPIKVSSNTRIAARCADGTGGLTCLVKVRYKT